MLFSLVTFWLCQKKLYEKFTRLTLMKLTAVRTIYRKFGYVCEHTVSIDVCELPNYGQSQQLGQQGQSGQQGQYGQQNLIEPPSKNGYSKADDCNGGNGNRHG